jgi:hypothetical protein
MAAGIELIRQALESRLKALDSVQTIFENTTDAAPDPDVLYQEATLMPIEPDNSVQGTTQYCERGLFQITILAPLGKGPGAASARTEQLRTQFKRGTTLTKGSLNVLITHTPKVASGYEQHGRWVVPVTVQWQSWVAVA